MCVCLCVQLTTTTTTTAKWMQKQIWSHNNSISISFGIWYDDGFKWWIYTHTHIQQQQQQLRQTRWTSKMMKKKMDTRSWNKLFSLSLSLSLFLSLVQMLVCLLCNLNAIYNNAIPMTSHSFNRTESAFWNEKKYKNKC